MTAPQIKFITSMATKGLLVELAKQFADTASHAVHVESVGGIDAARRVQEGADFDAVVLAAEAIDKLIASGHALAGRVDLVRSEVAVAVREGAARPAIDSEDALKQAVLAARSIGYSTGPSGVQLLRLFERWGIQDQLQGRLVQAPPGLPVGTLIAQGQAELGFQQLGELLWLPGITVLGPLPAAARIVTVFSAAVCRASAQPQAVRTLLALGTSPRAAAAKQRHGMEPA